MDARPRNKEFVMKRSKQILAWAILILVSIILILFWSDVVLAATRTFAWDQNTEPVEHYRVYRAVAPGVQVGSGSLWLKAYPPGQNPDLGDLTNMEFTVNPDGTVEISRNMLPDGSYYIVVRFQQCRLG